MLFLLAARCRPAAASHICQHSASRKEGAWSSILGGGGETASRRTCKSNKWRCLNSAKMRLVKPAAYPKNFRKITKRSSHSLVVAISAELGSFANDFKCHGLTGKIVIWLSALSGKHGRNAHKHTHKQESMQCKCLGHPL